jgi:hypothetical protein
MNLIYLGEKFYNESSTMMGILYTENWERSDWGKVAILLKDGYQINIRPATIREIGVAEKQLKKYKEKMKEFAEENK